MHSRKHAVAYVAPDRGLCAECGASVVLRVMTGMLRQHGDGCPGGGKPPVRVKLTEDIELPG